MLSHSGYSPAIGRGGAGWEALDAHHSSDAPPVAPRRRRRRGARRPRHDGGRTLPASARTRPYLLGDSVVAWSVSAIRNRLGDSVVIDALACRGAVASCSMPGETRPPSGLSTIRAQRSRLGDLVVIELGYNDRPQRRAIDRVMQELRTKACSAWRGST